MDKDQTFRVNFRFLIVSNSICKYFLPRQHSSYCCFCTASVSLVNLGTELKNSVQLASIYVNETKSFGQNQMIQETPKTLKKVLTTFLSLFPSQLAIRIQITSYSELAIIFTFLFLPLSNTGLMRIKFIFKLFFKVPKVSH